MFLRIGYTTQVSTLREATQAARKTVVIQIVPQCNLSIKSFRLRPHPPMRLSSQKVGFAASSAQFGPSGPANFPKSPFLGNDSESIETQTRYRCLRRECVLLGKRDTTSSSQATNQCVSVKIRECLALHARSRPVPVSKLAIICFVSLGRALDSLQPINPVTNLVRDGPV